MTMMMRHPSLLIVDDDPAMVRLLASFVRQDFGDEVDVSALTEAIDACQQIELGGVDILLTDLEMPNMNGLELLRNAKRRNAFTQVIFLTGHSTQDAILDALENGATDYLLKPVDRQQLVARVREALDRVTRWRHALGETWRQRRKAMQRA